MTYEQTIEWLYANLPMFSRIGADAIKKDLTNTIKLCQTLGNPQQKFKTIHIAGTNGKGSVSHMLAAILQQAGYKTGLYTSPHLKDFRERIKINGQMCEESYVISFVERIQALVKEIQPSFFEITVAMAFDYFASKQIDIAVIETGLGGRLDSTNIIQPLLSVITNIGWDHMQLLGNTLAEIAGEKAGIIKENTPVVIGEVLPETKPVFINKAKEMNAAISFTQEQWYVTDFDTQPNALHLTVDQKRTGEHIHFTCDLPGVYQIKNIPTVLESIHQLHRTGLQIEQAHIEQGLAHTRKLTELHGRWETIQQEPHIVADVAHNKDGIQQVLEQIELSSYNQLHIILGMVKDKDVDAVLALLPAYAGYYFTKAQTPRALNEKDLAAKAEAYGLKGQTFTHVHDALESAKQHAHKDDLILICGSVFLVGELL